METSELAREVIRKQTAGTAEGRLEEQRAIHCGLTFACLLFAVPLDARNNSLNMTARCQAVCAGKCVPVVFAWLRRTLRVLKHLESFRTRRKQLVTV